MSRLSYLLHRAKINPFNVITILGEIIAIHEEHEEHEEPQESIGNQPDQFQGMVSTWVGWCYVGAFRWKIWYNTQTNWLHNVRLQKPSCLQWCAQHAQYDFFFGTHEIGLLTDNYLTDFAEGRAKYWKDRVNPGFCPRAERDCKHSEDRQRIQYVDPGLPAETEVKGTASKKKKEAKR